MKKLISITLALVMSISLYTSAFAETLGQDSTNVEYVGQASENYLLTVPASLSPSQSGNVKAEGTWASNRKLVVSAPNTVVLTNDINTNETKTLDVAFAGINRIGNDSASITETKAITVGEISNVLFGTWTGKIVYNASIKDAGSSAGTTKTFAADKPGKLILNFVCRNSEQKRQGTITMAFCLNYQTKVEAPVLKEDDNSYDMEIIQRRNLREDGAISDWGDEGTPNFDSNSVDNEVVELEITQDMIDYYNGNIPYTFEVRASMHPEVLPIQKMGQGFWYRTYFEDANGNRELVDWQKYEASGVVNVDSQLVDATYDEANF